MSNPKKVYHVAFPEIPGVLTGEIASTWVGVEFDEPVTFHTEPRRYWLCSADLLFNSWEEALRYHLKHKQHKEFGVYSMLTKEQRGFLQEWKASIKKKAGGS